MAKRRKYGYKGSVGPAPGFTWDEVRDGWGKLPTSQTALFRIVYQARYLNQLRAVIANRYGVKRRNVSVYVNSWYRSPGYNRLIGGALFSQHPQARATDIVVFLRRRDNKIVRLSPKHVARFAEKVPAFANGGVGVYPPAKGNFTHVDHRGSKARW